MIFVYQFPDANGTYIVEAESKEEAILKLENNDIGPIKEHRIMEKQSIIYVAARYIHNAEK